MKFAHSNRILARSVALALCAASFCAFADSVQQDRAYEAGFYEGSRKETCLNREAMTAGEKSLDRIYDFKSLMIGSVVPPVFVKISDSDSAGALYRVARPARTVKVAPTWHDWFVDGLDPSFDCSPGKEPSSAEQAAQRSNPRYAKEPLMSSFREAYEAGSALVNDRLLRIMERMESDHKGMILYRGLYDRGLVGDPLSYSSDSSDIRVAPKK